MNKKDKRHLTIYFKEDEQEFLRVFSKRENLSVSAYVRRLVNEKRFGKSQLEIDLDLNEISLPDLYNQVTALHKRIEEIEKHI